MAIHLYKIWQFDNQTDLKSSEVWFTTLALSELMCSDYSLDFHHEAIYRPGAHVTNE